MLTVNMFSSAEKVKGQGVGSAYFELVKMLQKEFPDSFEITVNKWTKSDISHYHTVDPLFYFSTFFKKERGQRIGYVHFVPETLKGSLSLPKPFMAIFSKYLLSYYKRMDHLVVVNPSFISILVDLGIDRNKVSYIPNFVSQDVFYPFSQAEKYSFREKSGYKQDDFVVLGVGQIQERKGIDDFVRLAIDNPTIQFVWAGGFSFGKITEGYKKYKIIFDAPPSNLKFTDIISREEIAKYYNMADLFLLPSYNELFPMSILEAFNCGTPVMLRELELYQSIIKDDYIPAKDFNEMSRILKSLKKNRTQLDEMKEKTKKAAEIYSEKNLAKLWHDFYVEQASSLNYSVQEE